MGELLKVKGITYNTSSIIRKFEGQEGAVSVSSGNHYYHNYGTIGPDLVHKAKCYFGGVLDDFGIWLRNSEELHPGEFPWEKPIDECYDRMVLLY